MSNHEPLRSYRAVTRSSNWSFGLALAALLAVVGVWPALRYGSAVRPWALCAALIFLCMGIFASERLEPLNRLWFRVGLALNQVVSSIIMAVLFYGAVTPIGYLQRALGKSPLLFGGGSVSTYWIDRDPPGPADGSMKNQF